MLTQTMELQHALIALIGSYSPYDAEFAEKLSTLPDTALSPKQKRAAYVMLSKYRAQLLSAGIVWQDVPEPPIVTEAIQLQYERERAEKRGESPAPARIIEWPDPGAPYVYVRFPYNANLVSELRFNLGRWGSLRWQKSDQVWRFGLPNTPEGCRAVALFFDKFAFRVPQPIRDRLEDGATAGDRRKLASRASTTEWQGPTLLRNLYPFQRAGVEYIVKHADGRGMIADEMGLGKSIQSVASVHALAAYPCLMITKASTKFAMRNEWLQTIPGLAADKVCVVTPDMRQEQYEAASVVIVNYDLVNRFRDVFLASPFRSLIVDESHRCKNASAQRTEAIKAIATGMAPKRNEQGKTVRQQGRKIYEKKSEGIRYRILLTGTPVVNRPGEILSQLEIMGRMQDFGGVSKFKQQFVETKEVRGRETETKGNSAKIGKLNELLRSVCYVQRSKVDVAPELPPIQRGVIPIEMAAEFRREYAKAERDVIGYVGERAAQDQAFRDSIAHLTGDDYTDAIRAYRNSAESRAARAETIVRINHCKQIAGRAKVQAAKEWIADFLESGQKLILFARHIPVQAAIMADYPDAVHILGNDSAQDREAAKVAFQDDPAIRLIVCATEAASEGVTLTAASNVAFIELEWTPAAHLQAEARCYGRINDLHGANSWYFIATETIDESIMALLGEKMAVCDAIASGEDRARVANESTLGDLVKMLEAKR